MSAVFMRRRCSIDVAQRYQARRRPPRRADTPSTIMAVLASTGSVPVVPAECCRAGLVAQAEREAAFVGCERSARIDSKRRTSRSAGPPSSRMTAFDVPGGDRLSDDEGEVALDRGQVLEVAHALALGPERRQRAHRDLSGDDPRSAGVYAPTSAGWSSPTRPSSTDRPSPVNAWTAAMRPGWSTRSRGTVGSYSEVARAQAPDEPFEDALERSDVDAAVSAADTQGLIRPRQEDAQDLGLRRCAFLPAM